MSVALARKTDERAGLRAAIENKVAVAADLAKRQASLEAATEHAARAEERLRTASAAVGKQKAALVDRVARAIADGKEPPTATLQDKRDTENEARDEMDAAKAATAQIEAEVADLVVEVADAENAVLVQVNTILADVVARKFEAAKRLQNELMVLKNELYALTDKGGDAPRFADQMMDYNAERQRDEVMPMRDAVRHFLSVDYPNFADEVRTKADVAARSWKQVRLALREFADAPLPE